MALSVEQKVALLKSYDFHVVQRDSQVKPGHPGAWMVKDHQDNGPDQWGVAGDDLEQILDETIESHGLVHYLVGGWEHIFNENAPASECQIVLDKVSQTVAHAQIKVGHTWKHASRDDLADLLESMNDNEVWSNADMQEGFEQTNELPDWV